MQVDTLRRSVRVPIWVYTYPERSCWSLHWAYQSLLLRLAVPLFLCASQYDDPLTLFIMKKTLLTAIAVSFATIVSAQDVVSIQSGDASFLDGSGSIIIDVDYSNTKVGEAPLTQYLQEKGDDYLADWPSDVETAIDKFIEKFNRKNEKGAQIRRGQTVVAANYKMLFRLLAVDMGNERSQNIPFLAKDGGASVSGYVDIIDLQTGAVVCTFTVDEVRGASYPADGVRLGLAFANVAEKICDKKLRNPGKKR